MSEFAAALGLSTFCARVAAGLERAGMKVIAVDIEEARVNAIRDRVTRAVRSDLRDRGMLEEIGVGECSLAVLGLPDHFDIEVLVVHFLSRLGVKEIVAQVDSEDEAAAIRVVGATRVVFPEEIAAKQLVRNLTLPGLLERVDVAEDAAIIEIECPASFVGRSLKGLDLRRKYDVHIVGVIQPPEKPGGPSITVIAPQPEEPLNAGEVLMVLGKTKRLRNFSIQIEKLRERDEEERKD